MVFDFNNINKALVVIFNFTSSRKRKAADRKKRIDIAA